MLGLLFILNCVVSVSLEETTATQLKKGGFLVGDIFYKIDISEYRTQAQALKFCQSNGGQLATLSGIRMYRVIQAAVPAIGSYWMDGLSRVDRFQLTNNCTYNEISLSGIPPHNIDLSHCLTFYKGVNKMDSKVQLMNCKSAIMGVVCSIPINGCWGVTTGAGTTDITNQGTTPEASTKGTTTDATTLGTIIDVTTIVTTPDATTGGSTPDATTGGSTPDATTAG